MLDLVRTRAAKNAGFRIAVLFNTESGLRSMKPMLISFLVGLVVGAIYALLRVRSPAPPLIALAGLLGMVWGEQLVQQMLARKASEPTKTVSQIDATAHYRR
jgi:XapX domain-containing protein